MASGVSNFLSNLPSRGLFSSAVLSSNPGGMRVYLCEHDTSPPEGQQIKTNQQNILIRSLMINSKKADSNTKDKAAGDVPRKRAAEKTSDGRTLAKRANSQATMKAEGSSSRLADKDFQSLTVERLRALLKEKGLSSKGKKDELVARLKNAS